MDVRSAEAAHHHAAVSRPVGRALRMADFPAAAPLAQNVKQLFLQFHE